MLETRKIVKLKRDFNILTNKSVSKSHERCLITQSKQFKREREKNYTQTNWRNVKIT